MTQPEADDDVIRKINSLMAKAEASEFENERIAFRAKAEELMQKWRVESWQLDQDRAKRGESQVQKIGKRDFRDSTEFREQFLMMLARMGHAIGVKSVITMDCEYDDGRPVSKLTMVGFEIDLHYLSILFGSLMLESARTLEARPDWGRSFEENIYRLHESAVQWERIRVMMNEARENGAPWRRIPGAYAHHDPITGKFVPGASDGGVMRRAAKKWCDDLGVEYHTVVNGKRYRASYVKGFCDEVVRRFFEMQKQTEGRGTELVLYDRNKAVADEYNRLFPPSTLGSYKEKSGGRMLGEAVLRGRAAGARADLSRTGSNVTGASRAALGG